jgi:hypothetical protein
MRRDCTVLRMAENGQKQSLAIYNFLARATRLYEQEVGKPKGYPLLRLYVRRWVR